MTAAITLQDDLFAREFVAQGARLNAMPVVAEAVGISVDAARVLLRRREVKARIRELMLERFDELEISAQRVFEEIGAIAFIDPGEMLDANGDLLPVHAMSPRMRSAIASIDYETRMVGRGNAATPVNTIKIRLHDKGAMLQLLARHYKIIGDEKSQSESVLAQELAAALRDGRLRAQAARRGDSQPVEDARIIEPAQLPQPENRDAEQIW